jgi:hypothetical protein
MNDYHLCWIDDTLCLGCCGAGWDAADGQLHPRVLTRHLKWLQQACRWSMLEALNYLIESSSAHDHTFCTSSGDPIPQSSYRPRMDVL